MTDKKDPSEQKGVGRPPLYSEELADAILTEMMRGRSLRSVCEDEGMPNISIVMRWRLKHPEFREQYAHACKERTAYHAEEILDIADDGLNDTYVDHKTGETRTDMDVIARSKLRIDARKWLMSKMNPKDFGDKITTEHMGYIATEEPKTGAAAMVALNSKRGAALESLDSERPADA